MGFDRSYEVWLSEQAFISIVVASIETFPDETLGRLIGIRNLPMRKVLVQYAIAFQTAKRSPDKVSVEPKQEARTKKFMERVTRLNIVGDFHSHPEMPVSEAGSCQLSYKDQKSMEEEDVGLVIAVERDSREREWKHLPKGSVVGSVRPFSLKITGWLKQSDFRIARIHCPFALGLGR